MVRRSHIASHGTMCGAGPLRPHSRVKGCTSIVRTHVTRWRERLLLSSTGREGGREFALFAEIFGFAETKNFGEKRYMLTLCRLLCTIIIIVTGNSIASESRYQEVQLMRHTHSPLSK